MTQEGALALQSLKRGVLRDMRHAISNSFERAAEQLGKEDPRLRIWSGNPESWDLVLANFKDGIDANLEACFSPKRGDSVSGCLETIKVGNLDEHEIYSVLLRNRRGYGHEEKCELLLSPESTMVFVRRFLERTTPMVGDLDEAGVFFAHRLFSCLRLTGLVTKEVDSGWRHRFRLDSVIGDYDTHLYGQQAVPLAKFDDQCSELANEAGWHLGASYGYFWIEKCDDVDLHGPDAPQHKTDHDALRAVLQDALREDVDSVYRNACAAALLLHGLPTNTDETTVTIV
jgi:hypothetical protein